MRYLSEIELRKLLSYVREEADVAKRRGATRAIVDEVLVLLLLNTGLRTTELCNLRIRDIVMEEGSNTIKVRHSRGDVSRAIGITKEMAEYLRKFIATYRRDAKSDDPLLLSERGGRFTYMSIYSKIKRIGRQANIGNLHPRILRATYVVRLYDSEQDLWFVQRQAGHASARTTAIYAIAARDSDSQILLHDGADSESAEKTYSGKQTIKKKDSSDRAIGHRETISDKDFEHTEKCEACDKKIGAGGGTKIDSGQILCPECLKELHRM